MYIYLSTINKNLIMEQLIFHAFGDFVFQNNWIGNNKTKQTLDGYLACILHVLIYSLPFLFICSWKSYLVILITHFFIDKYRLAVYWVKLINWNWKSDNHGYREDTPRHISDWLLYITDNIFHITINYLAIKYL